MIRIAFTGGRDYKNKELVIRVLDLLGGDRDIEVLVGDASGLDSLVYELTTYHKCRVFAADWDNYGRAAGPRRNRAMLVEGKAELLVAFPGGRGTANCIRTAHELDIPVLEVQDPEVDA